MQSEWVSSRECVGSEGTLVNSRQRILVADDHKPMLDSLVRLLSDEFDIVAAVGDGVAAVTQAQQLKPDLLVLDPAKCVGLAVDVFAD